MSAITKVLICGTPGYDDYENFCRRVDLILTMYGLDTKPIEIVTTDDNWVVDMVVEYANAHHRKFKVFEADWERYGRSAGYRRNEQACKYCLKNSAGKFCIAFWDDISRGTKHLINLAYSNNFIIKVVEI